MPPALSPSLSPGWGEFRQAKSRSLTILSGIVGGLKHVEALALFLFIM